MGEVCEMLTFAYKVGGWVIANAYVSKISKSLYWELAPRVVKERGLHCSHLAAKLAGYLQFMEQN